MKRYRNLLAELEYSFEDVLKCLPNEENLPKAFLEVLRKRDKKAHRGVQRIHRLEGLPPPPPHIEYLDPVDIKVYRAALLCRFVDEYERGDVSKVSLDLLHKIVVDVLEGMPFDLAFPLPDREPDPALRKKWGLPTIAEAKRTEIGDWVNHMVEAGEFPSYEAASEEAELLFTTSKKKAKEYAENLRNEQNIDDLSTPKF